MSMVTFNDDEKGYLDWIAANPTGFVINAEKQAVPYMLHRANCIHIARGTHPNYTTTTYEKICSLNKQELVTYGKSWKAFWPCQVCEP